MTLQHRTPLVAFRHDFTRRWAGILTAIATVLTVCTGCQPGPVSETSVPKTNVPSAGEPKYIAVQHILIGFEFSVPGKQLPRTKEEAEQLATELVQRARDGEDFSKLVVEYSDDYDDPEDEKDDKQDSIKRPAGGLAKQQPQTGQPTDGSDSSGSQSTTVDDTASVASGSEQSNQRQEGSADNSSTKTDEKDEEPRSESSKALDKFRKPGVYRIANFQNYTAGGTLPHLRIQGRDKLVKNFGDVAFQLKVGEVGLAEYDRKDGPYGWHVIKRID